MAGFLLLEVQGTLIQNVSYDYNISFHKGVLQVLAS
jgi:hypothetical protein